MTVRQMIDYHDRKLHDLYRQHRNEKNEGRLIVIRRNIDAKQNFISALWQQLGKDRRAGRP